MVTNNSVALVAVRMELMGVSTRLSNVLKSPRRIGTSTKRRFGSLRIKLNNFVVGLRSREKAAKSGSETLGEIKRKALEPTDINDHLVTLFVESLSMNPRLIVELGVRGGESTFVMARVAAVCGSRLVSVDIEDCSSVENGAVFVQSDDVEFAGRFEAWCRESDIDPRIDVLFIDTSHLYEHTVQEIAHWFPLLAGKSKVFFHDTNLKAVFQRKDGSMGTAWDNERGVIRAVEEYLGTSFDEDEDFVDFSNGWLIKHYAYCNGLTILERIAQ
jgi:cephalosporin hydroxylase